METILLLSFIPSRIHPHHPKSLVRASFPHNPLRREDNSIPATRCKLFLILQTSLTGPAKRPAFIPKATQRPPTQKRSPPDTMKGAGSSTYTLKHYFYTDGVGFEPTEGCPSAVFKTAAFNRSATHPSGAKREAILAYTARECKLFLSVGLNNIRNWQDQNARRRQRGA